jgi:hypothetical protein
MNYQCIVCGRALADYPIYTCPDFTRYCSLECAAYDQALKDPKKSWVLFGSLVPPKRHHEAREE